MPQDAPKSFELIVAQTAGFCMGVQRAVRMALGAADKPRYSEPIRTEGPLIHNSQVLQVLAGRGVNILDEGEHPGTVVIRAHGVTVQRHEALQQTGAVLLDATCPHVRRVQRLAARYASEGYMCIVVGDTGHAEVESVLSHADGAGHVVAGPDQVAALPDAARVIVVAQTTQDHATFNAVVAAARARYSECLDFDTICRSTELRQNEVKELAKVVDAVIVVGGFNSANTKRLAELSAADGTPTFSIEADEQLDLDAVFAYERVGLTAGASTPSWMIRKVVHRILDAHARRTHPVRRMAAAALRAVVNSNAWAAGAAAAMTYASARLLQFPPRQVGLCVAVTFFFVLSQHLLNQYSRRTALYLTEPAKADFFSAHERSLLLVGIASSVLAPLLAWDLGWQPLVLVVLGSLGGLMYRRHLPSGVAARIGIRSLEQLPGSKELFIALAWAVLGVLVPALTTGRIVEMWPSVLVVFAVTFLLAFQRTLALDLQALQADRIFGRETLARMVGDRGALRLFLAITMCVVVILVGLGSATGCTDLSRVLPLIAPFALVACIGAARWSILDCEWAELAVDGQFYLAGLIAALV
jgi:(E)-4-hydroxy-3-methyl-but-2-enyl pyrophosphate reductase